MLFNINTEENTTNDILSENCFVFESNKGLSVMGLNIVTLTGKFDNFKHLIENNSIDVIVLNETRLDNTISDRDVNINEYDIYRKDRNREGGGVAMYINCNGGFTHNLRNDLMDSELKMIVEIRRPNTKPILVLAWYRPPNSEMSVFDKVSNVLEKIESINYEIIMIGDLNWDPMSPNKTCYTTRMIDLANSFHLHQLFSEPTRVTQNSRTLIDHIYTSTPNKINNSGVLHTGISDHSAVFVILGREKKVNRKHKFKTCRNYKHFDVHKFKQDMQNLNWQELKACSNVDDAVDYFEIQFLKVANRHAPPLRRREFVIKAAHG
ncbi:uncharacterized protein LOC117109396 [Anneissia japonica]|uniref:uncharacterized protein LOC117109396 n=1 Tax=Anneissia japonica TaxID=1529436 RepID=UPI001425847F|nr:uncharacterized protein LOC117109396 [Anneissia japonica]